MKGRLSQAAGSEALRSYCSFLSSSEVGAFQIRRVNFFLRGPPDIVRPNSWGVEIPGTKESTYATWITDIRPLPVVLVITRIRATGDPETFGMLLSAVMEAAEENRCSSVEIWNLDPIFESGAKKLGGSNVWRENH